MSDESTSRDKRTLSREAQEAMRIAAVQRVFRGESAEEVARSLNVARSAVYRWVKSHREGGPEALRRRKAPGRNCLLDREQIEFIRNVVLSTSPPYWCFSTTLWTRAMVAELVRRAFAVSYSVEGVGRLMRQDMNLSTRRVVRRANVAGESQMRRWLLESYPPIRRKAEECGATIYFAGEAGDRSIHRTPGSSRRGAKVMTTDRARTCTATSLISAASAEGKLRYMQAARPLGRGCFTAFIERLLINEREGPVYLMAAAHPIGESKTVERLVNRANAKRERLRVFALPPYASSPGHVEFLRNHLEDCGTARAPFHSIEELEAIGRSVVLSS